MDKEGLKEHLKVLRSESFEPREWTGKGYIHKGTIRTNGRLLQILAFKVKELQCVRYHRFPDNKLPNSLTSVTGGTSSFLTEARNVFRTDTDVKDLLDADPNEVAILSLDLGTSCIVGASVRLPPGQTPATMRRPPDKGNACKKKTRRSKRKAGYRKRYKERRKAGKESKVARYFELVVKRNAVSQPTKRFSKWLEVKKANTIGVSTSRTIQDIESSLPPLKGEGASFRGHVQERNAAESDLDNFYNNSNIWKHQWDAKICCQEEYYQVADGLLKLIGGAVGRPRMPHQRVVIAIGLAKFTAVRGPPSLDGTFQSFFINLARSLDYLVIGINEYYTSKKCPTCLDFVCSTSDWRTLYCKNCKCFRQRDTMASDNMNAIVKSYLTDQKRPLHLQPRRQDGSYPWNDFASSSRSEIVEGSIVQSTITRVVFKGPVETSARKRPSNTSGQCFESDLDPSRILKKNKIL
ncbi:hypothetical protein BGZ79_009439 [Entomortierella chlamydospora]|nr:hypothetical protein BGZ79_009439 [Entomortierella chlamydospora]